MHRRRPTLVDYPSSGPPPRWLTLPTSFDMERKTDAIVFIVAPELRDLARLCVSAGADPGPMSNSLWGTARSGVTLNGPNEGILGPRARQPRCMREPSRQAAAAQAAGPPPVRRCVADQTVSPASVGSSNVAAPGEATLAESEVDPTVVAIPLRLLNPTTAAMASSTMPITAATAPRL